MAADLKVGRRAPAFSLSDSDGKVIRLSSLVGKKKTVLVFFRTLH
jgi:peroxiredoxin